MLIDFFLSSRFCFSKSPLRCAVCPWIRTQLTPRLHSPSNLMIRTLVNDGLDYCMVHTSSYLSFLLPHLQGYPRLIILIYSCFHGVTWINHFCVIYHPLGGGPWASNRYFLYQLNSSLTEVKNVSISDERSSGGTSNMTRTLGWWSPGLCSWDQGIIQDQRSLDVRDGSHKPLVFASRLPMFVFDLACFVLPRVQSLLLYNNKSLTCRSRICAPQVCCATKLSPNCFVLQEITCFCARVWYRVHGNSIYNQSAPSRSITESHYIFLIPSICNS